MVDELCVELLGLARRRPVLIGINDVQHADWPSLHFLAHLARHLRGIRALFVCTAQPFEDSIYQGFCVEFLRQPYADHLRLGRLTLDGVASLLRRRFDKPTAHRLAAAVHATSGGNPFLATALIEDCIITASASARQQPAASPCPGEEFREAVLAIVTKMPDPIRQGARALAVLGDIGSARLLGRLIDFDIRSASYIVDTLEEIGVVADGRIRHSAIQKALLRDPAFVDLADMQLRAARALQENGTPAPVVGNYILAAGHAEGSWAVMKLQEAAEDALTNHRLELAGRLFELADRSNMSGPQGAAVKARLVDVVWQRDPAEACRHFTELLAHAREGHLSTHAAASLVRRLVLHGRMAEADEVLRLLSNIVQREPDSVSDLPATLLWLFFFCPALVPAKALLAPAGGFEALAAGAHNRPWVQAAVQLPALLARQRREEVLAVVEKIIGGSVGDRMETEATELVIAALDMADAAKRTAALLTRLSDEGDRPLSPISRASGALIRAKSALRRGDLLGAHEFASAALAHMPQTGWGLAVGEPLSILLHTLTEMGRQSEAAELLVRPVPEAIYGTRFGLLYLRARGRYHLSGGRFHAALSDFLAYGETLDGWMNEWNMDLTYLPWRTDAAEAYLGLGERTTAKDLVENQLDLLGSGASRHRAISLRILSAAVEPKHRPELLRESAGLLEADGDLLELAYTLAELGRVYQILGERGLAKRTRDRAWRYASHCHAEALRRRLLGRSDSHHSSITAVPFSYAAKLSDAERRVVALAAEHYTNREIANKLYITVSTVEQHLTRAYRKLNIRNRQALSSLIVDSFTPPTNASY
ncbi:LuxR family transcriptional regulator [Frankia sp. Cppng1_Ct_nod]|uniref:helix-turn-helix transcriptional regulator n=1 Tax=Frankia sp. Cppng1_Ct_nod TaxID=2897162 RepID=UPI001F5E49AC|nr:LuxR family transcriptional regulator [Frankia sp. Cppng1_Ct_nod]